MKSTSYKSLILLLFIAVIAFSCKKDSKDSTPTTSKISCKINGTTYTSEVYITNNMMGTFYTSFPFETFTIAVNVPSQVGTTNLATNPLYFGYIAINNQTYNTNVGGSGEFVISKLDEKTIEGTFYFTGKSTTGSSTMTVTEGKFVLLP